MVNPSREPEGNFFHKDETTYYSEHQPYCKYDDEILRDVYSKLKCKWRGNRKAKTSKV